MTDPSDAGDPGRLRRTREPAGPAETAAAPASPPGGAADLRHAVAGGARAESREQNRDRRGILAMIDHPLVVAFVATLGVLGALLIGSALGSIATILIYIILALFISLGLDPVVRRLERAGMRRGAGIAIVFVAFAVLVALFLIFVLPPVLAQIAEFIVSIPQAMAEIQQSEWFVSLNDDLQAAVGSSLDQLSVSLADPHTVAAISGGALAVGIGVAGFISASFIVVALTLYFLASLAAMKRALYSLAPARNRPRLADMTERITASVGGALIGSVILSTINAIVVFVLHLLIGLPFPALMALIAFVITLIPLFGSVIFWILGTVIALFSSPSQALIFGIAYLVYIQLESYVVSPRVMNREISIPAALVLIGALIGGALAGVLGVLLALPVMASLLLIIREVVVPKQDLKI
ncbi:AI-2E family transporter [Microbacterium sp.]|uniref:AI-2E family transporter n=1 Tax=Microbacterium sp. TaxID=51671 RepID=UPI002E37D863|nr:AI-2E family transporter [Microbacterium sp.]HEX5730230.1 AI-2E family transporter [Microbacterium sp.]